MSEQTTAPTERDELTLTLVSLPWRSHPADVVAGKILAAGYRKPRRITTRDELDSLPVDSVVLSNTIAYQYYGDESWAAAGRFYFNTQISLPAYVLHEPKVAA